MFFSTSRCKMYVEKFQQTKNYRDAVFQSYYCTYKNSVDIRSGHQLGVFNSYIFCISLIAY